MVSECFNLCIVGISAVFDFFGYCVTQLGAWAYILGAFIIFSIFRLLLKPLIGAAVHGGSSDTVRRAKNFSVTSKNKGE